VVVRLRAMRRFCNVDMGVRGEADRAERDRREEQRWIGSGQGGESCRYCDGTIGESTGTAVGSGSCSRTFAFILATHTHSLTHMHSHPYIYKHTFTHTHAHTHTRTHAHTRAHT
jgi:hypothetical protein